MPSSSIAGAILAFDKKMKSGDPGDVDYVQLELANLVLHVNGALNNKKMEAAIIGKLYRLFASAFPEP